MKKTTKNKKFDSFLSVMGKIGQQRHLTVLRDSFATFLPFLILGAVGLLFITVIFGGYDSSQNSIMGLISKASTGHFKLTGGFKTVSDGATKLFGILPDATIGSISIYITLFIGWYLSKSRNKDNDVSSDFIASALSLGVFLGLSGLNPDWFGAKGLLPAIIVSILTTELYLLFSSTPKLTIKMPAAVPPAVARAFTKLIPIVLTGLSMALINYLFLYIGQASSWDITSRDNNSASLAEINKTLQAGHHATITAGTIPTAANSADIAAALNKDIDFKDMSDVTWKWHQDTLIMTFEHVVYAGGDYGIIGFIYQIITAPLMSLISTTSGGLGLALLYVFLVGILWFLGLHGANMMDGIFLPIWLSALAFNIADQTAGLEPEYIFAQPFFEGFIWIGGGMGTLMMTVVIIIFSKRKEEKEVAKFAVTPGIFNINEPAVFGYPIVLNWRYFVPFVFTMPIMVIVTWLFMGPLDMVAKPAISMPWTTPPILGSLIVTKFDWHSIIPTIINLGISFVFYLPFILIGNKGINGKINKEEVKTSAKKI